MCAQKKSPYAGPPPFRPAVTTRDRNLEILLNIMEAEESVSRPRLVCLSGLGAMTVQRATRMLILRNILREERRPDPQTGRMCMVLSPAPLTPILVVDLSVRPYAAYLITGTHLLPADQRHLRNRAPSAARSRFTSSLIPEHTPIFCIRTEVIDSMTQEENLCRLLTKVRTELYPRILNANAIHHPKVRPCRQGRAMKYRFMMQPAGRWPHQGICPVMILPPDMTPSAPPRPYHPAPTAYAPAERVQLLLHTMIRQLSTSEFPVITCPEAIQSPAISDADHPTGVDPALHAATDLSSATLYAITHSALALQRTSLLCILCGEHPDIFILLRADTDSDWFLPPCLDTMTRPLADILPSASKPWNGAGTFPAQLATCLASIRPDAIYFGAGGLPSNVVSQIISAFPTDCAYQLDTDNRQLPVAVRGAAMMIRRKLWNATN